MSLDAELFGSSTSKSKSSLLSPSPRPKTRKSTASLHDDSLAGGAANARFSLAHELAHALMPEPSAGSKLLAEEFGIEYDEGAEGIDEPSSPTSPRKQQHPSHEEPAEPMEAIQFGQPVDEIDPNFDGGGVHETPTKEKTKKKKDAMQTLSKDLNSTERFLSQLRTVDGSSSSTSYSPTTATTSFAHSQGSLEQLASTIIQKLNSSAQDRESQVRELLTYEREFRKMSGDVLGVLDELPIEVDQPPPSEPPGRLGTLAEEESLEDDAVFNSPSPIRHRRGESLDWEIPPHHTMDSTDQDGADDESDSDAESDSIRTPTKPSTPPPALPPKGTFSPRHALPQLTYIRTTTTSLVSSLSTLSEHAQINSVFTTEAGRKIRALRGKLSDWKDEYDEVEKSKLRILEWEKDEWKGRGRKLVEEELSAFEKVLGETDTKTRKIISVA